MSPQRKIQFGVLAIIPVLLIIGTYFLITVQVPSPEEGTTVGQEVLVPETPEPFVHSEVIGTSVEGRSIEAVTFGNGGTHLLFVGGMHGGYEWNSSLLAYAMIEYLTEHPDFIPDDVQVSIIPSINPDGLFLVTGTEGVFAATDVPNPSVRVAEGRFNAHGVDLNRNFACKWQPESSWQGNVVSAGTAAFSEPEAAALREYVSSFAPAAVAFWHSKANNVYASECTEGVLPATLDVMNAYATAGGYGAVASFDAYPVTGDAEGWLASLGIPAVTVELATANSIEWTQNLAGVDAMLKLYSVAK